MTAFNSISNPTFLQVILFTDTDGRAKFREEALPMPEGNPQAMLSKLQPSGGFQVRHSPVGFRSTFLHHHATMGVHIGRGDGNFPARRQFPRF
jgi:hypothetical protein